MSVPKGKIHMMNSIIKNKNSVKTINVNQNIQTQPKPKTQVTMKTARFNSMHLVQKKGVSHLAYQEAKKGKVSSANYKGKWMGFMYRDPNKPRGGCGVCYQH